MAPVPFDFKKLSDVVNNDVVKKTVYDELVKKVNAIATSKLVNKTDYNARMIKNIENDIPSITNLSTTAAITVKIKNKSDISGFINNSDLNENIKALATKAGLKTEQNKIVKLQTNI